MNYPPYVIYGNHILRLIMGFVLARNNLHWLSDAHDLSHAYYVSLRQEVPRRSRIKIRTAPGAFSWAAMKIQMRGT